MKRILSLLLCLSSMISCFFVITIKAENECAFSYNMSEITGSNQFLNQADNGLYPLSISDDLKYYSYNVIKDTAYEKKHYIKSTYMKMEAMNAAPFFNDSTTISLWINIQEEVGQGGDGVFYIGKPTKAWDDTTTCLCIGRSNTSKSFTIIYRKFFEAGQHYWATSETFSYNTWHHVVIAYDPANVNNNPSLYVNGKECLIGHQIANASGLVKQSTSDMGVYFGMSTSHQFLARLPMSLGGAALYKGILSEDEIINLYNQSKNLYLKGYPMTMYCDNNAVLSGQLSGLSEGEYQFKFDFTNADINSVTNDSVKLINTETNQEFTANKTKNQNEFDLSVKYLPSGKWKIFADKNILGKDGNPYQNDNYEFNIDVAENALLRQNITTQINNILMDSKLTDDDVLTKLLVDYDYILMLPHGDNSDYSRIVNKASIFNTMRQTTYESLDKIREAFNGCVTLQKTKDVTQAVEEFNTAVKNQNTNDISNLLFIKYISVFQIDTENYDKLKNKSEALKMFYNNTYSDVSDIKDKFELFVAAQALSERKEEFLKAFETLTIETIEKHLSDNADISTVDLTNTDYINQKTTVLTDVLSANIKSLDELNQAFYQSVLLNGINSVEIGRRDEIKRFLKQYANYWNAPSSYVSYADKTEIYKALNGKTFSSIQELETTVGTIVSNLISNQNAGSNNGGSSSGTGGGISHKTGGSSYSSSNNATQAPIPPTPEKIVFNDLDDVSWAKEGIIHLFDLGIVEGKADKVFAPNDNVTRAEFAKIAAKAFEIKDYEDSAFSDVLQDDWSYPFVSSLSKAGIINGKSDSLFGKEETLSRQDLAVILKRIADFKEIALETPDQNELFSDDSAISDYAKDAVYSLKNSGILNGAGDNAFVPNADVTRAAASKTVYMLLNKRSTK